MTVQKFLSNMYVIKAAFFLLKYPQFQRITMNVLSSIKKAMTSQSISFMKDITY